MFRIRKEHTTAGMLALGLALAPMGGCEDLPGDPETQGAVIGGVAGAGAGGGYLIGAQVDRTDADEEDQLAAREAVREARTDPADPADVFDTTTADLNNDGFVTMDEVIAMDEAGLTDAQIIDRLEATDQVFELTEQQEDFLLANGVSRRVVNAMPNINQEEREALLGGEQVIGRDAPLRYEYD